MSTHYPSSNCMQYLNILDKCTQIVRQDRIWLRNQIKSNNEEILQFFKGQPRVPNMKDLQIKIRKYVQRVKEKQKQQQLMRFKQNSNFQELANSTLARDKSSCYGAKSISQSKSQHNVLKEMQRNSSNIHNPGISKSSFVSKWNKYSHHYQPNSGGNNAQHFPQTIRSPSHRNSQMHNHNKKEWNYRPHSYNKMLNGQLSNKLNCSATINSRSASKKSMSPHRRQQANVARGWGGGSSSRLYNNQKVNSNTTGHHIQPAARHGSKSTTSLRQLQNKIYQELSRHEKRSTTPKNFYRGGNKSNISKSNISKSNISKGNNHEEEEEQGNEDNYHHQHQKSSSHQGQQQKPNTVTKNYFKHTTHLSPANYFAEQQCNNSMGNIGNSKSSLKNYFPKAAVSTFNSNNNNDSDHSHQSALKEPNSRHKNIQEVLKERLGQCDFQKFNQSQRFSRLHEYSREQGQQHQQPEDQYKSNLNQNQKLNSQEQCNESAGKLCHQGEFPPIEQQTERDSQCPTSQRRRGVAPGGDEFLPFRKSFSNLSSATATVSGNNSNNNLLSSSPKFVQIVQQKKTNITRTNDLNDENNVDNDNIDRHHYRQQQGQQKYAETTINNSNTYYNNKNSATKSPEFRSEINYYQPKQQQPKDQSATALVGSSSLSSSSSISKPQPQPYQQQHHTASEFTQFLGSVVSDSKNNTQQKKSQNSNIDFQHKQSSPLDKSGGEFSQQQFSQQKYAMSPGVSSPFGSHQKYSNSSLMLQTKKYHPDQSDLSEHPFNFQSSNLYDTGMGSGNASYNNSVTKTYTKSSLHSSINSSWSKSMHAAVVPFEQFDASNTNDGVFTSPELLNECRNFLKKTKQESSQKMNLGTEMDNNISSIFNHDNNDDDQTAFIASKKFTSPTSSQNKKLKKCPVQGQRQQYQQQGSHYNLFSNRFSQNGSGSSNNLMLLQPIKITSSITKDLPQFSDMDSRSSFAQERYIADTRGLLNNGQNDQMIFPPSSSGTSSLNSTLKNNFFKNSSAGRDGRDGKEHSNDQQEINSYRLQGNKGKGMKDYLMGNDFKISSQRNNVRPSHSFAGIGQTKIAQQSRQSTTFNKCTGVGVEATTKNTNSYCQQGQQEQCVAEQIQYKNENQEAHKARFYKYSNSNNNNGNNNFQNSSHQQQQQFSNNNDDSQNTIVHHQNYSDSGCGYDNNENILSSQRQQRQTQQHYHYGERQQQHQQQSIDQAYQNSKEQYQQQKTQQQQLEQSQTHNVLELPNKMRMEDIVDSILQANEGSIEMDPAWLQSIIDDPNIFQPDIASMLKYVLSEFLYPRSSSQSEPDPINFIQIAIKLQKIYQHAKGAPQFLKCPSRDIYQLLDIEDKGYIEKEDLDVFIGQLQEAEVQNVEQVAACIWEVFELADFLSTGTIFYTCLYIIFSKNQDVFEKLCEALQDFQFEIETE